MNSRAHLPLEVGAKIQMHVSAIRTASFDVLGQKIYQSSKKISLFFENLLKTHGKRTVVVFWLINPDRRIISTKHIDKQQGKMSFKDAEMHRIKLMEERKYHKQKFNVRDLNLCEH